MSDQPAGLVADYLDGCSMGCENDIPCCVLLKQLQARFDHMKLEYDRMVLQINHYRGELERLRRIYGTKVVPI